MPINYVPNDPRASKFNRPLSVKPSLSRKGRMANFKFGDMPVAALYGTDTISFLRWQIRESALRAMSAFEAIDGRPLDSWARAIRPRVLNVNFVSGHDINAYYTGNDLSFFQYPVGGAIHFTGASTDVVAHEVGHAILDALRPDLWEITFLEVAAYHEAFGDCIAMLTTLHDASMRKALATGNLWSRRNFAETWGEHLAWMAGGAPRQAKNKIAWHLPTESDEEHDFSVIFTACFYDMILAHFRASKKKSSADLWAAAKTIGTLLFTATRAAPAVPRFFHAVGRAMALSAGADKKLTQIVKDAFEAHGMALGAAALTAPKSRIAGSAEKKSIKHVSLSSDALADIRGRLNMRASAASTVRQVRFGSDLMAEATFPRAINVGALPYIPNRTFVHTPETVLIGNIERAKKASGLALMSALPDRASIAQENADYVAGLTHRGQLQHRGRVLGAVSVGMAARSAAGGAVIAQDLGAATAMQPAPGVTHVLLKDETGPDLSVRRVRFACRCGANARNQPDR